MPKSKSPRRKGATPSRSRPQSRRTFTHPNRKPDLRPQAVRGDGRPLRFPGRTGGR